MINISCLASSSKGNAYLLNDGRSLLLLECGISIAKIRQLTGYKLSQVAGCLVSHEHQDHCRSVRQVMKYGVDLYMSIGTANELQLTGHRLTKMKPLQIEQIGSWYVTPFPVKHNALEPFGYLIKSRETGEQVLFFIDTFEVDYTFGQLSYIMAGVDYDESSLQGNDGIDVILLDHVHDNHMSLEAFKEWLLLNDLSIVKQIWVLHLSRSNADPGRFKKELQRLTGKEIIIAE